MTKEEHVYISTACQHGLHARCRVSCKFCESPCLCGCHTLLPPTRIPEPVKITITGPRPRRDLQRYIDAWYAMFPWMAWEQLPPSAHPTAIKLVKQKAESQKSIDRWKKATIK